MNQTRTTHTRLTQTHTTAAMATGRANQTGQSDHDNPDSGDPRVGVVTAEESNAAQEQPAYRTSTSRRRSPWAEAIARNDPPPF